MVLSLTDRQTVLFIAIQGMCFAHQWYWCTGEGVLFDAAQGVFLTWGMMGAGYLCLKKKLFWFCRGCFFLFVCLYALFSFSSSASMFCECRTRRGLFAWCINHHYIMLHVPFCFSPSDQSHPKQSCFFVSDQSHPKWSCFLSQISPILNDLVFCLRSVPSLMIVFSLTDQSLSKRSSFVSDQSCPKWSCFLSQINPFPNDLGFCSRWSCFLSQISPIPNSLVFCLRSVLSQMILFSVSDQSHPRWSGFLFQISPIPNNLVFCPRWSCFQSQISPIPTILFSVSDQSHPRWSCFLSQISPIPNNPVFCLR